MVRTRRESVYSLLVFGILLVLSDLPAWSQSAASGTVSGQVTDATHAAVGGAQVKMTDTTRGATLTTMTNDAGRYSLLNLEPGFYDIGITKTGFSTYQINRKQVEVGQTLTINATLAVGTTT